MHDASDAVRRKGQRLQGAGLRYGPAGKQPTAAAAEDLLPYPTERKGAPPVVSHVAIRLGPIGIKPVNATIERTGYEPFGKFQKGKKLTVFDTGDHLAEVGVRPVPVDDVAVGSSRVEPVRSGGKGIDSGAVTGADVGAMEHGRREQGVGVHGFTDILAPGDHRH